MRGRGAGEGERDGRGDVTEEEELARSCSFPIVRHVVPYALSCRGLCCERRFTFDVNVVFFPHEFTEFSSFRGGGKDPHVTILHVVMSDASAGWQRRHDVDGKLPSAPLPPPLGASAVSSCKKSHSFTSPLR